MRVTDILLFLTLVVSPIFGVAAPTTTTPIETSVLSGESDPLLEGLEPRIHRNYEINVSFGFSGGHFLERDEYQQGPYLALRYQPLVDDLPTWDYQAEVTKDNLVGLSMGRRWYCCQEDPYNPFLRLSANLILEGAGELGGFAEIRRWRARASAGIGERFISEFGVGMAVTGPDLYAQFGYNF